MNKRRPPSAALLLCATLAAAALCALEARQAFLSLSLLRQAEGALRAARTSLPATGPSDQPAERAVGAASLRDILRSHGLKLLSYAGMEEGRASLRALANDKALSAFLLALEASPLSSSVLSLRLSRDPDGYALDMETSDAAR